MTASLWALEASLELGDVYAAHAPSVARWAGRLGGPRVDAEDVMHDVFLVVERRLSEFRGEAKLSTWIYRITHRVVLRHLRRAKLRSIFGALEGADTVASAEPSPLDAAVRSQAATQLYAALDRLGEKYRTAIILHDLEGLSAERIAEMTGVEVATVWVRLHRGKKKLEELLG